jgi:energy-coupling factor transport system permease protein|uniref:Energy-coupling factor transporter transmembrane protein EcfT n=1 Tax=Desulfobacca acetoxidans TaxID=60893 RepID=A0A7V6A2Y4_9BACT
MQENFLKAARSGGTLVHRLDPRTKLALLCASFVMAVLPERPAVAGMVASLVLLHLALARAWSELYRIRWLLTALLVFSLTVWSLLAHGETPLFWRVSRQSLEFGAATFLKFGAMMVAGLVLLATTRVEELFLGLVRLGLPYSVAFAFALALRWVPEVYQTALRVKEAQEVRGLAVQKGSPFTRLKRHLPLLVPIFLLTLRRTQTMSWALEARGFQAKPRRTYYLEIRMALRDWLVLTLALVLLAGFITLHLAGWDRISGLEIP